MTTDEILFDAEERMEKATGVFKDELRGLRTGRATPALVDSLRVNEPCLETLSGGLRGHWKEGAWASFGSACRRLRV